MHASLRGRVAVVSGRLDDLGAVRDAARGHDACIHNALVWRDEDPMGLDDVRASTTVFLATAEAGVEQLVYTSSTAVHKPYAAHMDETMRLSPTAAYGAAKASNELFLGAISWQTKMRCNIVRPGRQLPADCSHEGAELAHGSRDVARDNPNPRALSESGFIDLLTPHQPGLAIGCDGSRRHHPAIDLDFDRGHPRVERARRR